MKFWSTVTLAGSLATSVTAHTWIEQLMVIAANGTMVGQAGFPRGNVLRSSPSFGDPTMVNLIPGNGRVINDIRASDLMCKDSQTTQTQTSGSPRLQAPAGANVALRYQENGHVSLPQNQPGKPENRGTVYVYGTTQPSTSDKFLSIHRVWNAEGTGGDGRGLLLSTQNFDDSQCYQVNGGSISSQRQKTFAHTATGLMGSDLWCQQDIKIPTTAPSGKPYTLYWVWDWPTLPGTAGFPEGKQEIYTTSLDVDIVQGSGASSQAAGNAFVKGQDLNFAAIGGQFSNIANPTAVIGQTIAFSSAAGAPSATNTAGFTSYLTETAGASVAPSAQKTQPSAAAASTITQSSPQGPVVPFFSAGSGTQRIGFSTNAPFSAPSSAAPASVAPSSAATPSPAALSSARSSAAFSRPTVSPVGTLGNTGTAIATASSSRTTGGPFNVVVGAGPSTVTRVQTNFSTVFQTKMETVYETQQKRDITPTTAAAHCSKTEAVYRLKARNPFFILPVKVNANPGC